MTDCTERQWPAPGHGAAGEGHGGMTRKAQS